MDLGADKYLHDRSPTHRPKTCQQPNPKHIAKSKHGQVALQAERGHHVSIQPGSIHTRNEPSSPQQGCSIVSGTDSVLQQPHHRFRCSEIVYHEAHSCGRALLRFEKRLWSCERNGIQRAKTW